MDLRFQRRVTLFPGVRLNFSAHGISASIGPRGASVTVGTHGSTLNLGIPGTGLSFRQNLTPGNRHTGHQASPSSPSVPTIREDAPESGVSPIRSAAVAEVTSEGLAGLKELIKTVMEEREQLRRSIPVAREELAIAERRLRRAHNWFFGLFLKKRIPERQAVVEAKNAELKSQEERQSGAFIDAEFALDEPTQATFGKLTEVFEQLAGCGRIWDLVAEGFSDRRVTRSYASRSVDRTPVRFYISEDPVLQTKAKVLHLKNANGADLLLYPGFVLMQDASDLALIDLRDIKVTYRFARFVEEDPMPSDAVIVDYTWKKCNKDGSPDRRFANNYRIPIAGYGSIIITTASGLNKEYQFSSAEKAERFGELFTDYQNKLRALGVRSPAAATAATALLPTSPTEPSGENFKEPAAPEFNLKSLPFLQAAEAVSVQHAIKVLEQFGKLFQADMAAFNGPHSMAELELFANKVATAPGIVQAFLRRVPDTKAFASKLTKIIRDLGGEVLAQMRTAIEQADPTLTSTPEAQNAIKVIREAESVLRH